MWKNREQMEEILFLLQPSRWPVQVNRFVPNLSLPPSSSWWQQLSLFLSCFSFGNLAHPKMLNYHPFWDISKTILIKLWLLWFPSRRKTLSASLTLVSSIVLWCIERERNSQPVFILLSSSFFTVMTYMPQDFRGTLIRQQKERSERNKQAEVDALVSSGGTIRDTYALLWKQQMERWAYQFLLSYLICLLAYRELV